MTNLGLQSSLPAVATKWIRRAPGGSQGAFVQCGDGLYYTLKFNNSPQGPNVLANELLGSRLARAAGLPVAETRFIEVTRSFLDANPFIRFETQTTWYRPEPGTHLGSLVIGDVDGPHRALSLLRPSDIGRVTNRQAFLGMYLFDVWAMHQDKRQAVFVSDGGAKPLRSVFLDHGHLFGGPYWRFRTRKFIACHYPRSIYSDLWNATEVGRWVDILQTHMPRELSVWTQTVPRHWYAGSLTKLADRLLSRLDKLPKLILEHSLEGMPLHRADADNALPRHTKQKLAWRY